MQMIQTLPFGTTQSGESVTRFVLKNDYLEVALLDYGGTIQSLKVPSHQGEMIDVVLGFDGMEGYQASNHDKFLGALIGRCANRIAHGHFTLNDKEYKLLCNNGPNHLHGGNGFDKRMWSATPVEAGVAFHLKSGDGDEGYPGNLDVTVTYTLRDSALCIDYEATTDADTLCNLTNHAYFNLSGHDSGSITDHSLQIFASHYTPIDAYSIPTGEIVSVYDTPMEFMDAKKIGNDISSSFAQLEYVGGYDHNYCINQGTEDLNLAAIAVSDKTGIRLETKTTMPGIQFYSGNYLDGCPNGKENACYGNRSGFCLETQFYPDAINHENFAQPILRPTQTYHHQTEYSFSLAST